MAKNLAESAKYLNARDFVAPFIFILVIIPSLIFKFVNKLIGRKIWLICEDPNTARDNGYCFFKYIREKHPSDACYYAIDRNYSAKVSRLGNTIYWGSLKHWIYYLSATYNISSQKSGNPSAPLFYVLHVKLGLFNNRIFLQHGITKDYGDWLHYDNTNFRYIVSGCSREYDFLKEKLGYDEDHIIMSGFPRWDNLYDFKTEPNSILFMPTWRNWLGRKQNSLGDNENFLESDFYKNWNGLLNNPELLKYLEKTKTTVYFYPHIHMQRFLNDFECAGLNVRFVNQEIDIQEMLKKCELMVTDFSSVAFEFAYMKKPVIYFQFDEEKFRKLQLQPGYYDYKKDGYGPITKTIEETVYAIKHKISKEYESRADDFFNIHDNKNCERLYEKIKEAK